MSSMLWLITRLSGLDPCHFVCCVFVQHLCSLFMSPVFVCLSVCRRLVTTCVLSVTKRHKAHLKRLDRRWTLGGVISRQQSRGELRQTLHRLPLLPLLPLLLFSSPHLTCCLLSHGSTRPSSHAHTCSVFHPVSSSSKCIYHEPHNPPRLTTNWH